MPVSIATLASGQSGATSRTDINSNFSNLNSGKADLASPTFTGTVVLPSSITITTPTIASFTNATHNHTNAAGGETLAESALALTDITTNDFSTSKHGFVPKGTNVGNFLKDDGTWGSGGSTVLNIIPYPNFMSVTNNVGAYDTNTLARLGQIVIPFAITVNKISFQVPGYTSSGTIKVALFSEDGQTQKFSVTSGTISGTGLQSITVGSVSLSPGIYYLVALPTSTTNITIASFSNNWGQSAFVLSDGSISGKPISCGTYTVSAGTMPSTITLASIIGASGAAGPIMARLDN
jgi:hypothetical protein